MIDCIHIMLQQAESFGALNIQPYPTIHGCFIQEKQLCPIHTWYPSHVMLFSLCRSLYFFRQTTTILVEQTEPLYELSKQPRMLRRCGLHLLWKESVAQRTHGDVGRGSRSTAETSAETRNHDSWCIVDVYIKGSLIVTICLLDGKLVFRCSQQRTSCGTICEGNIGSIQIRTQLRIGHWENFSKVLCSTVHMICIYIYTYYMIRGIHIYWLIWSQHSLTKVLGLVSPKLRTGRSQSQRWSRDSAAVGPEPGPGQWQALDKKWCLNSPDFLWKSLQHFFAHVKTWSNKRKGTDWISWAMLN